MNKIFDMIAKEEARQNLNVELIASENYVSDDIRKVLGSCLTNKYAEGYPGKRYYGGCENVDEIELYCQDMFRKVFNTDYYVNVQPHSGTQANMAAFAAVLKPGDTILAMDLNSGGHLSHGSSVSFSGKLYNIISYGVDEDGWIDYKDLENKAKRYSPDLVLIGASSYSRTIDFERINDILRALPSIPLYMVDMAHIAGLVAAGDHPSPFGYADIITTTTHKTLRGPRGGLIFCKQPLAKRIDSAVFPNIQGGPHMHVIAAKAICAEEACTDEYKNYIHQVVSNTQAMAEEFKKLGYHIVTNGTDNHLFMIDLSCTHPQITGKDAQEYLDRFSITVNKNMVPNDTRKPSETSGIRIGCAAMTTRGWDEKDAIYCARAINNLLNRLEYYKENNVNV